MNGQTTNGPLVISSAVLLGQYSPCVKQLKIVGWGASFRRHMVTLQCRLAASKSSGGETTFCAICLTRDDCTVKKQELVEDTKGLLHQEAKLRCHIIWRLCAHFILMNGATAKLEGQSSIWFACVAFLLNNHFKGNQRTVLFPIPSVKLRLSIVVETAKKGLRKYYLQWIVWSSKQHTSLTCKCYWQRKADWFSRNEYFFPWIWLDFSSKEPALAQTKYPESSTFGRGTRSSYLTMCPEISARWSLLWTKFQIPVARQTGKEGSKCRPLEHMWRIPFIHSPRFIIDGNFYIYRTVLELYRPCGAFKCILARCMFDTCACALAETLLSKFRAVIKVLFVP